MNNIKYYTDVLKQYKGRLVDNLNSLGIQANNEESYNSLIPKVYNLAGQGEVVLSDFSFLNSDLTEEEIDYIYEHLVITGPVKDVSGKFDAPNIKKVLLYKWPITTATSTALAFVDRDSKTGYAKNFKELDAHGLDLSKATVGMSSNSSVSRYSFYKINIDNTKLNEDCFEQFTVVVHTSDEDVKENALSEISMNNVTYTYKYIQRAFTTGSITSSSMAGYDKRITPSTYVTYRDDVLKNTVDTIDMSTITYEVPIIDITESFNFLGNTRVINLNGVLNTEGVDKITLDRSFIMLPKLEHYPIDLSLLEGKQTQSIVLIGLESMVDDIVYPNVTLTRTDRPISIMHLHKCKHLDLSNVVLPNTYSGELYITDVGTDLTDEELENAVFKLPNNIDLTKFSTISFANCKIITGDYTITEDTQSKSNNIPQLNGTRISNFSYTSNSNPSKNSISFYLHDIATLDNVTIEACDYVSMAVPNNLKIKGTLDIKLKNTYGSSSSYSALTPISKTSINNIGLYKLSGDVKTSFSGAYWAFTPEYRSRFDFSGLTNITSLYSFGNRINTVTSIDIHDLDLSNCINNSFIYKADLLTDLTFGTNLGKGYTTQQAFANNHGMDFSSLIALTRESVLDIFNKVYDLNITYDVANGGTLYTQRLYFHSSVKAKLTPEDIAIATNKGWTVS